MVNKIEIPKSVMNLAKRLHAMASQYDGLSIVSVRFVAAGNGTVVFWTKPSVIPLEPRLEMDIFSLEKQLGEEQLSKLLNIIVFGL